MTYTKEQVLAAIRQAYYDGMKAGKVEYGDDSFNAEEYLPDLSKMTYV